MFNIAPDLIISRIITLLIAFTVHEFAHAWTANYFGDTTAKANGRLTLNPAAHLDLFGSLMLLFAGFGWAKPVPVNPYTLRRRSPSAMMWVSLAGPLSNLMLAVVAAIPFRLDIIPYVGNWPGFLPTPMEFIYQFILINLLLMVFNLIPLAPLDGEKVLEFFLPPSGVRFLESIRPYGPLILMALIFVLPSIGLDLIGSIMYPVIRILLQLILGVNV